VVRERHAVGNQGVHGGRSLEAELLSLQGHAPLAVVLGMPLG
jgi:hypothetical protein